jgi:hypothetical protein
VPHPASRFKEQYGVTSVGSSATVESKQDAAGERKVLRDDLATEDSIAGALCTTIVNGWRGVLILNFSRFGRLHVIREKKWTVDDRQNEMKQAILAALLLPAYRTRSNKAGAARAGGDPNSPTTSPGRGARPFSPKKHICEPLALTRFTTKHVRNNISPEIYPPRTS